MNLKQLRQFAGDDVAQDAMDDLAEELAATQQRADFFFRGEHSVQCTCAPPHGYQMREAKCPRYVERLEAALRGIQEMASEDLRLGEHSLQTSLHQIEANARAALRGRIGGLTGDDMDALRAAIDSPDHIGC